MRIFRRRKDAREHGGPEHLILQLSYAADGTVQVTSCNLCLLGGREQVRAVLHRLAGQMPEG